MTVADTGQPPTNGRAIPRLKRFVPEGRLRIAGGRWPPESQRYIDRVPEGRLRTQGAPVKRSLARGAKRDAAVTQTREMHASLPGRHDVR